jgi:hypothetical protein
MNVYAVRHSSLPFSLCMISVADGTKISLPTCMMYRRESSKGNNKVSSDLGVVSAVKGDNKNEVEDS